jgi:hypothetical protein
METYTIIEDVFGDDLDKNQITSARGFLGNSHVPEDMKPPTRRSHQMRTTDRPDFPELSPRFPQMPQMPHMPHMPHMSQMSQMHQMPQMHNPQDTRGDSHMSPMVNALVGGPIMYPGVDSLQCRDVFTHVENCPLCKSYFRHDAKFYWMIIAILIVIILVITRGGK